MKLNKIFISGLAMLALTSCNDYLEVDPATNVASTDLVFGSEGETRTALYGIRQGLLGQPVRRQTL